MTDLFDPYAGMVAPVHPPRDLALPGRVLRAVLERLDRVIPRADTILELSMKEIDRDAQATGYYYMRIVYAARANEQRRAAWRKRFGGLERSLRPSALAQPVAIPATAPAHKSADLHHLRTQRPAR